MRSSILASFQGNIAYCPHQGILWRGYSAYTVSRSLNVHPSFTTVCLAPRAQPPRSTKVKHLEKSLGFSADGNGIAGRQTHLHRCIHLQLLSMGLPSASARADAG